MGGKLDSLGGRYYPDFLTVNSYFAVESAVRVGRVVNLGVGKE